MSMPSQYIHIGEAIRARRDLLGLTQEELCTKLGWKISRVSEISDIEQGKNINLTLKRLKAFAIALNCHADDLVFMLNADFLTMALVTEVSA